MVQEDKNLLIQDLCARLPYGVKIKTSYDKIDEPMELIFINPRNESFTIGGSFTLISGLDFDIYECKPYLFPLSSMTEEQFMELKVFADLTYEGNTLELVEWDDNYKTLEFWLEEIPSYHLIKVFDWLNKNHFDYRGLIEKSLALDATNLGIYEL